MAAAAAAAAAVGVSCGRELCNAKFLQPLENPTPRHTFGSSQLLLFLRRLLLRPLGLHFRR